METAPAPESRLPTIRTCRLGGAGGISATLSHYPPFLRQPRHEHGFTQVSFLLAGAMRECQGGAEFEMVGPAIGCKPMGRTHSVEFGDQGALIFALRIDEPSGEEAVPRHAGWTGIAEGADVPALVRAAIEAGEGALRAELLWDLALVTRDEEGARPSTAPPWLKQVRSDIRNAPELLRIDAVARNVGIHRTQLTRLFRRHFGLPPSLYRRQVMAARAICHALQTRDSLADTACSVGFADQSHLARTVKTLSGLPLSRIRALLA
jgi:AraC family transcriptional regulator